MDALKGFMLEPIIIKKGKTEYAFHYDKLVITKKERILREIAYNEIREITYNPKFGWRDFLSIISFDFYRTYNAFVIDLKVQIGISDKVFMRLSSEEFEKIKDVFDMPIDIV